MNNLVFGKYIPIDSFIHRLDPRSKLISMFIMIFAIFIPEKPIVFVVIAIIEIIILILSKIGIRMVIKSFKPMLFMMLFLLIVNLLTIKTGDILYIIGSFKIYSDAVYNTLFVIVRLMLMLTITTILTATTKPLDLTLAIEWLLKPFEIIHLPSHEIALMVSIALRFIPTIIEETMRIMNAQKSRGVDFENGGITKKAIAILSLIVPLFSVAFERAYQLADAMEARGYVPGATRTKYHVLKFVFCDYLYVLASILILSFSIISRFYL